MNDGKLNRRRWVMLGAAAVATGLGAALVLHAEEEQSGKWKTHAMDRPRPPIITPGTFSTPEQPGKPPSDAIVLFDGKDLDQWTGASGKPAAWKIENGYAQSDVEDIITKEPFGDVQLHLEWAEPSPGEGDSQGRGNSGVILMREYETQVLDSYKNDTYPDGQCAAEYSQNPPLVNACRPPGEWQTYDIVFHAPRFDGEELKSPATITVFQNGVLVQDHFTIRGQTAPAIPKYKAHPEKLPLELQFHHNPVRFRNIWIRPLEKLENADGTARDEAGYQPEHPGKAD